MKRTSLPLQRREFVTLHWRRGGGVAAGGAGTADDDAGDQISPQPVR